MFPVNMNYSVSSVVGTAKGRETYVKPIDVVPTNCTHNSVLIICCPASLPGWLE